MIYVPYTTCAVPLGPTSIYDLMQAGQKQVHLRD